MPVINVDNPLNAASDAIGSYVDRKRQVAAEQAAKDYQASRDQRADMEADRTYGLQAGEAADSHQRTLSDLQTAEQQRQIAAADEAFTRSMDNINREIANLTLTEKQQGIKSAALDIKIKTIQANYAKDLAKANLSQEQAAAKKAQADAVVSQALAAIAPQQARANLASTQASTANTEANTALTRAEIPFVGQRAGGRGGAGASTDAYDNAMAALSPKGQQFVDMIYDTSSPGANPPTRAQAMVALRSAQRGGGLTPDDVKNIETIIASKQSSFVTPQSQIAGARSDANQDYRRGRDATHDSEAEYRDVARGKLFNALPPAYKDAVRNILVDQHMSVADALAALPSAPFPQPEKDAIARALNGQ